MSAADTRARTTASSPTRLSASAHTPLVAPSFTSRLPVPRIRCSLQLANKENEQLTTAQLTTVTIAKTTCNPLFTQQPRTHRQPLASRQATDANRTATSAVQPAAAAAEESIVVVKVPSPRARRQWVKSMDLLPAVIPAILQCSPSSAISDDSGLSDDSLFTPERSEGRHSLFDPLALLASPVDVKASTIAALQAAIADMQTTHAAEIQHSQHTIRAMTDELAQHTAQLDQVNATNALLQHQLADSCAQLQAMQTQLANSELRWQTAQQQLSESAKREGEVRELKKQLATLRIELRKSQREQSTPGSERSEQQSAVDEVRLPVLVGDCIRRQRRVAVVG